MNKLNILLLGILLIGFTSASGTSVWQGQHYIGTKFQKGLASFNFTVYDDISNGNICFSNITNLTRGNFGEWYTEQNIGDNCNNASIDYFLEIRINGDIQKNVNGNVLRRLTMYDYLRRDTNDIMKGELQDSKKVKLKNSIVFENNSGDEIFSIYHAINNSSANNVPNAFLNSLIFETENVNNKNRMEICFWDNSIGRMSMCINEGAKNRATTIYRSLQISGNNKLPNNENFTLCENYDFIDCDTDGTGADLGVEDDIEAQGIYIEELRFKPINDKGICNLSNSGMMIYEIDNTSLGTHYACRQKKDGADYEWKALY